jgi:hypothetical protein
MVANRKAIRSRLVHVMTPVAKFPHFNHSLPEWGSTNSSQQTETTVVHVVTHKGIIDMGTLSNLKFSTAK